MRIYIGFFNIYFFFLLKMSVHLSNPPSLSFSQTISLLEGQTTSCRNTVSVTNIPQSKAFSCLQQSSSVQPQPSIQRQGLCVTPPSLNPSSFSMICFIHTFKQPYQVNRVARSLILARNKPFHTAAVTFFLSIHSVKNRQPDDFLQQLKDSSAE